MKWQEEEEKAWADYFKMIEEDERIGFYRITVVQMIEKESAAKKKKRDMEMKKKKLEEEKIEEKEKKMTGRGSSWRKIPDKWMM